MQNEDWENKFRIGETIYRAGCFTLEGYIVNQNLDGIAYRLGLPQWMVAHGIYISYALRLPNMNEFELAGTTRDSTDKFVDYSGTTPKYDAQRFESLYTSNAAVPVSFQSIKKKYHDVFGVNKLVKVLAPSADHYPPGTIVPQFLMTSSLPCYVAAFIPPNGNFRV